jgi:eukaryotic-like serine/threonine-protein kinase
VAIKVLPAAFSADPDRLRRFEQESRAAAALNHPNILAVYDIGADDGHSYIVSELLEGETLRSALGQGALPVRKAIDYALQICHGLAAAHHKGIVHRDLKPENVFITTDGRVKILDFGLAKLTEAAPATALSMLPTTPVGATIPGMVLGTLGYMSPEQLRGQEADHRSDIFAFGVILHEMLTGQQAFKGDTPADTMSAILTRAPGELGIEPLGLSSAVGQIIERCVEKSPSARFNDADDVAFALEAFVRLSSGIHAAAPEVPRRRPGSWVVVGVALALALAGSLAYLLSARRGSDGSLFPYRFNILPPPGYSWAGTSGVGPTRWLDMRMSPNGHHLALIGSRLSSRSVFMRDLDGSEARPLPGTDGATQLFWSPDSQFIGFFADGRIKIISWTGAQLHTITEASNRDPFLRDVFDQPLGATWCSNGSIVFARIGSQALWTVPSGGGTTQALTVLDETHHERQHAWPECAPDGDHILYMLRQTLQQAGPLMVFSLKSGRSTELMPTVHGHVEYVSPGLLLLARDRALIAQRVDLSAPKLIGNPVVLAEDSDARTFSASQADVVVWRSAAPDRSKLLWFDRSGAKIAEVAGEFDNRQVALSPDDNTLALDQYESADFDSRDVWLVDTRRGTRTRFTVDPTDECCPIWSPDGQRLAFPSNRNGVMDIFERPSNGSAAERLLLKTPLPKFPKDWSRDERWIVFESGSPNMRRDLWLVNTTGDPAPIPLVATAADESDGQFSPDGQFVAYTSDRSGQMEVYVQGVPPRQGQWQVSTSGGVYPRWRADGRELFYVTPARQLMSVTVSAAPQLTLGIPKGLFELPISTPLEAPFTTRYAVTADGQRFVVHATLGGAVAPATVVLNWTTLLKR